MPKQVTIQRDWNNPIPFKIEYNGSTIRFNSFEYAVAYCAHHDWIFDYDDMLDL